ncbi:MAG: hypothetical protein RL291_448, partial [Pseudomonadota bacterium]
RDGSVTIHQDGSLYASLLGKGEAVAHTIAEGRGGWLHVARGAVKLNGEVLNVGDGVAITTSGALKIEGHGAADGVAEVLLFDMGA